MSLILGGCATKVKLVSVHLPAMAVPPPSGSALVIRDLPSSDRFSVPSTPEVVGNPVSRVVTDKIRLSIKAQQKQTFRLILARVTAAYRNEANALRARRLAGFDPVRSEILAHAFQTISSIYVAYSDRRGPLAVDLAAMVGFPDPDPHSKRDPAKATGFRILKLRKAAALRKVLNQQDAAFLAQLKAILAKAQAETDTQLTALLQQIENEIGDVDQRAYDDALRQATAAEENFGPLLAEQPSLTLPPIGGASISVSQPGWQQSLPANTSSVGQPTEAQLKDDLRLWLGINRYRLDMTGRSPDATPQFLLWLSQTDPAVSKSLLPKSQNLSTAP